MKKKQTIRTAIGFTNTDQMKKDIKWLKRGFNLANIGLLIAVFSASKLTKHQTWYEAVDQASVDNVNVCEQNIIEHNKL